MAVELGDGFHAEKWDHGPFLGPHLVLISGDLRIAVHHKTNGDLAKRRLRFKGLSPGPDLDRAMCLNGPEVSASMDRPPGSIAGQITSRLLPHYRLRAVADRAQWDRHVQRHTARETEAARLAAQLPRGKHFPDTYLSASSCARWNSERGYGGISVFEAEGELTYNIHLVGLQLSPAELAACLDLVHTLNRPPAAHPATIPPAG
ncbi:hypothetical protein [Nonomuraea sp. NPDC049784]|uniref:hypothetical protein n=1 Tax=Nonomuraea sp. NPDC049784 TaxID=3154361 RepID=UPI00340FA1AA